MNYQILKLQTYFLKTLFWDILVKNSLLILNFVFSVLLLTLSLIIIIVIEWCVFVWGIFVFWLF